MIETGVQELRRQGEAEYLMHSGIPRRPYLFPAGIGNYHDHKSLSHGAINHADELDKIDSAKLRQFIVDKKQREACLLHPDNCIAGTGDKASTPDTLFPEKVPDCPAELHIRKRHQRIMRGIINFAILHQLFPNVSVATPDGPLVCLKGIEF